ncbi:MAG: hypothetical protein WBW94_10640 [Anaerolineales bacterium]
MNYNLEKYTDDQVSAVLKSADIGTAIELWEEGDWDTYSKTCDVLRSLLRAGYGDVIETRHVQFMYFITTHLYSRFPFKITDSRLFQIDLPAMTREQDATWARSTIGEFWTETL